jgi:opacity protein-like surface antigen
VKRGRIAVVASVAACLSSVPAVAQEMVSEQQMTLPGGRFFVQGFAEINLSTDAAFEPFSIAPDLWYGVNDQITVGLVHSGRASTGLYGPVGNGLCLTGEEGGCPDVYGNIGIDGRYHFYRGSGMTLSAEGGLFAGPFDPFTAALKLGVVGRWQAGAIAIDLAPNLFVGLSEREPEEGADVTIGTNNKEILNLPITALYMLSSQIGLALQLGAVIPMQETGDLYTVGISLGGQYMLSDRMMIDAAFSLPMLVKGDAYEGVDAFDVRTFTLGFGYAF